VIMAGWVGRGELQSPSGDRHDPVGAAHRRNLPDRYGSWKTAHERLRRWTAAGTWDRILDKTIVEDDSVGAMEWTIGVDSSHVRGPPAGCGGPEKGSCRDGVEALVVEGKPSDTPVADGP
jgi:hypothetical protein